MNILFVTEYFWPEIGGLEKSTERLAIELARGNRIKVATRLLSKTKKLELRSGVKIHRFSHQNKHGKTFVDEAKNIGLLKEIDVICIFGVGHDKEVKHWIPLFESGLPVYLKVGTSGDLERYQIDIYTLKKLRGILCQNDDIKDEAIRLGYPKENCFQIKNGLDISIWGKKLPDRIEARKKLDISKNAIVCSCIGRFVERKNFPLIISSFVLATANIGIDKELVLLVHGSDFGQHDGEENRILQLIKKINKTSRRNVTIKHITHFVDTMISLSSSDIFITLGEREGAPNIIIEAMAASCPVIASRISGHEVYIKDKVHGILTDLTEENISKSFQELIENEGKRKEMAIEVRKKASFFDIRETAKIYENVFKQ